MHRPIKLLQLVINREVLLLCLSYLNNNSSLLTVYKRSFSLQMQYACYFQQNLPPGGGTVSDSDILDEWNSGRHSPKVSICGSDDDPPSGSTTPKRKLSKFTICKFLTSSFFDIFLIWCLPFAYLGSAHQIFILLVSRTCASSLCTNFAFMSFCITSLHLSFSLPIFRCSLASMFSLLTSSSVFLSTWPYHLNLASLILLTYVCHTCPCSYLFCSDLLNLLSSHHPPKHSHLYSF